ncbi:hypothetical protein ACHAXS_004726, partial [Conticribra weissflogii]
MCFLRGVSCIMYFTRSIKCSQPIASANTPRVPISFASHENCELVSAIREQFVRIAITVTTCKTWFQTPIPPVLRARGRRLPRQSLNASNLMFSKWLKRTISGVIGKI